MTLTMLFADGDSELREAYRRFARERGYHVLTSGDGLDCVGKLRAATPDMLVLDLDLPWGGGDGVLGWLNEEPQFLPRRIVLTSAAGSSHNFDSLGSHALVRTLTKPFPLSVLLDGLAFEEPDEQNRASNGNHRRGILVVDDEPTLRDILQTHLQQQGFRVWAVANGEEALDHCCNHGDDIALILLDVQMPGLDGPETFDGIRELDIDIPVCFMSGDLGYYKDSDLLGRGARHLFGKPFRLDEILRVVHSLTSEPVGRPQEV